MGFLESVRSVWCGIGGVFATIFSDLIALVFGKKESTEKPEVFDEEEIECLLED